MKKKIIIFMSIAAFISGSISSQAKVCVPVGINAGAGSLGKHFGAEMSFIGDNGAGGYLDFVGGNGTRRFSCGPEIVMESNGSNDDVLMIFDGGYLYVNDNGKPRHGLTVRTSLLFKSDTFLVCPVIPYIRLSKAFKMEPFFEVGALVKCPIGFF